MGIHVKYGTLPTGIDVSHVYMCFRREVVYVTQSLKPKYIINANCRVYPISASTNPNQSYDIIVPVQVKTDDISAGVYTYLYDQLKRDYPAYINLL
jgi:hypothetical protein